MDGYRHPTLGFVEPISSGSRPKKVWKHLYAPEESWRRIVPAVPADVASRAEAILGVPRAESRELPFVKPDRWARLRAILDDHHDSLYGPAYMAELRSPETDWAPAIDDPGRECGLSPKAVYLVVSTRQPRQVVTAYRPHPPVSGVHLSEASLKRHAQHFFEDRTMRRNDLAQRVAETLASLPRSAPTTAEALWELASAVGYAKALEAQSEALRALLGEAEGRLASAPRALVDTLAAGLTWTATLDDLAESLKEEDLEEVGSALLRAEELVVVAPVLNAASRADEFLGELGELVAWASPSLARLVQSAGARAEAFREDAPARDLWSSVAASVTEACVRLEAPAVRPEASLVDELIKPAPAWAEPWLRLVAEIPARVGQKVTAALENAIGGLKPVPALAMGEAGKDAWGLRELGPIPEHARMFVVAEECPEGDEVELGHEIDLWLLAPGERALVVLVAGEKPVDGATLREVLVEAQKRADVAVRTREVSRPR